MRLHFWALAHHLGCRSIGCTCDVCTSTDSRNRRMRPSIWIELDGKHIVIDTPAEFRLQAIEPGCPASTPSCIPTPTPITSSALMISAASTRCSGK